jgi:hypothetical protein
VVQPTQRLGFAQAQVESFVSLRKQSLAFCSLLGSGLCLLVLVVSIRLRVCDALLLV